MPHTRRVEAHAHGLDEVSTLLVQVPLGESLVDLLPNPSVANPKNLREVDGRVTRAAHPWERRRPVRSRLPKRRRPDDLLPLHQPQGRSLRDQLHGARVPHIRRQPRGLLLTQCEIRLRHLSPKLPCQRPRGQPSRLVGQPLWRAIRIHDAEAVFELFLNCGCMRHVLLNGEWLSGWEPMRFHARIQAVLFPVNG